MKFGQYLQENKNPDWKNMYIDYDKLKDMIKALEEKHLGPTQLSKGISLTVPMPTNAAGMPVAKEFADMTQEQFTPFWSKRCVKLNSSPKKWYCLILNTNLGCAYNFIGLG